MWEEEEEVRPPPTRSHKQAEERREEDWNPGILRREADGRGRLPLNPYALGGGRFDSTLLCCVVVLLHLGGEVVLLVLCRTSQGEEPNGILQSCRIHLLYEKGGIVFPLSIINVLLLYLYLFIVVRTFHNFYILTLNPLKTGGTLVIINTLTTHSFTSFVSKTELPFTSRQQFVSVSALALVGVLLGPSTERACAPLQPSSYSLLLPSLSLSLILPLLFLPPFFLFFFLMPSTSFNTFSPLLRVHSTTQHLFFPFYSLLRAVSEITHSDTPLFLFSLLRELIFPSTSVLVIYYYYYFIYFDYCCVLDPSLSVLLPRNVRSSGGLRVLLLRADRTTLFSGWRLFLFQKIHILPLYLFAFAKISLLTKVLSLL
eukprot:gene6340-4567_t